MLQLLEEVCAMGRDSHFVCQKPQPKIEAAPNVTLRTGLSNDAASSDDEDEEDEVGSTHSSITKQGEGSGSATQDAST